MSEDFITIKRDDLAQLCIDIINARSDGRVAIRGGVDYAEEQIIRKVFKAMPSADRPQGEWIDDEFIGQYRCSECDYYSVDEFDYCPNCGARMKGTDDESLDVL